MRSSITLSSALVVAYMLSDHVTSAITLDISSEESIKSAASTIAYTMMTKYTGNNTGDVPGNLPSPYYWWICGGMMGNLIDYWYYTNDTTYNAVVSQAILHQAGTAATFMPANQSKDEGNDDQSFWGFTAMTATETNFPNPPADQPQWLEMAQGVFNQQAFRWDTKSCSGGLKWQIYLTNNGYDYKNSISNGAFFAMGARLAVYTGNQTFADWAEKTWDWMEAIGLMDGKYNVYDGSNDLTNCTSHDSTQWTYNAGVMLLGAANMYKYTNGSAKWFGRVNTLLDTTTSTFFTSANIMWEQACENSQGQTNFCNNDQLSFRAHLSRWMAATMKLVPSTRATIFPLLKTSAKGAAQQCTGGTSGNQCGARWTSVYDGTAFNFGQQMSALSVIGALLQDHAQALVTTSTGGTSVGNNDAGSGVSNTLYTAPVVGTGGRAGAGILTAGILGSVIAGGIFMVKGD